MALRVLVMDDAENAAESICRVLTTLGYEAACCTESLQCVEVAREFKPDVILLDLAMPGIDGFELLNHLRECKELKPRIIALSGHVDEITRQRCAVCGFDGFVAKPASEQQLQLALNSS